MTSEMGQDTAFLRAACGSETVMTTAAGCSRALIRRRQKQQRKCDSGTGSSEAVVVWPCFYHYYLLPLLLVLVLVVGSCFPLLPGCEARGRLVEPPSRASMWRFGFVNPVDFNDDRVDCGGFVRQWRKNRGRCGVCGDPWDEATPRAHETRGKYGRGNIVRTYTQGQAVVVEVEVTAASAGHFEYRVCPRESVWANEDQGCFKHQLQDDQGRSQIPVNVSEKVALIRHVLHLPQGVTCPACVMQWKFVTQSSEGRAEYRACSDITITPTTTTTTTITTHESDNNNNNNTTTTSTTTTTTTSSTSRSSMITSTTNTNTAIAILPKTTTYTTTTTTTGSPSAFLPPVPTVASHTIIRNTEASETVSRNRPHVTQRTWTAIRINTPSPPPPRIHTRMHSVIILPDTDRQDDSTGDHQTMENEVLVQNDASRSSSGGGDQTRLQGDNINKSNNNNKNNNSGKNGNGRSVDAGYKSGAARLSLPVITLPCLPVPQTQPLLLTTSTALVALLYILIYGIITDTN